MAHSQSKQKLPEAIFGTRILAAQAFSRAAGAPLVRGNGIFLLEDAGENYPAWLDAIRSAQDTVHFENNIFCVDDIDRRFADALVAKAKEGIRVRLLYNWMGGLAKTSSRLRHRLYRLDLLIAALAQKTLLLTDACFVGATSYVQAVGRAALQRAGGWLFSVLIGIAAPLGAAAADASPKTIAMLDFELIDETGDTTKEEDQKARLVMISQQLRAAFSENNLYTVVNNTPASTLIAEFKNSFALHSCNGCDVEIGRALKTDRVMTAWVQKVSNLILNINIQIRDVKNDAIILNKSVDIRGNTDESWSRGIRHMVRSMVEKNQRNL